MPLIWYFRVCQIPNTPGFYVLSCQAQLCLASKKGIKNKSVWKQKEMKRKEEKVGRKTCEREGRGEKEKGRAVNVMQTDRLFKDERIKKFL